MCEESRRKTAQTNLKNGSTNLDESITFALTTYKVIWHLNKLNRTKLLKNLTMKTKYVSRNSHLSSFYTIKEGGYDNTCLSCNSVML